MTPGAPPARSPRAPKRGRRAADDAKATFVTLALTPLAADNGGRLLERLADILADALIADLTRDPSSPEEEA